MRMGALLTLVELRGVVKYSCVLRLDLTTRPNDIFAMYYECTRLGYELTVDIGAMRTCHHSVFFQSLVRCNMLNET
jgi:hypothetical protein